MTWTSSSTTTGIFAPDVAQKLISIPLKLLSTIRWVEGKRPEAKSFKEDLEKICDEILTPKTLRKK